jgi:hypothetical protein
MSTVRIVANAKSGNLITGYKNNAEYGYIQLEQTAMSIASNGWIRESKRVCILRAKTEQLKSFVNANKTLQLPGKIVIKEYLESELPDTVAETLNKNVDYETRIASYIKRAGVDGDELTLGGERILRFSNYDPTGNDQDVLIQHDNVVVKSGAVAQLSQEATE